MVQVRDGRTTGVRDDISAEYEEKECGEEMTDQEYVDFLKIELDRIKDYLVKKMAEKQVIVEEKLRKAKC